MLLLATLLSASAVCVEHAAHLQRDYSSIHHCYARLHINAHKENNQPLTRSAEKQTLSQ